MVRAPLALTGAYLMSHVVDRPRPVSFIVPSLLVGVAVWAVACALLFGAGCLTP